jgi:predicted RNA binding protein YcfA (HicA-like mRNA interferase family)
MTFSQDTLEKAFGGAANAWLQMQNNYDLARARRHEEEGWQEVNHVGSHKQFKHPTRPGRVTVPHPNRDTPRGTLKSIEKQAGIKFR